MVCTASVRASRCVFCRLFWVLLAREWPEAGALRFFPCCVAGVEAFGGIAAVGKAPGSLTTGVIEIRALEDARDDANLLDYEYPGWVLQYSNSTNF